MASEELISVIIPVYNVANYLNRCVDSLLKQTYANLDIMLIDDGSTDNSGKICDDYVQADPRVRVTHFPTNCGLAFVRNFGIEWARGDYINFVDADDWVVPEYIENLYQTLTSHQADIAISGYLIWHPENTMFSMFDVSELFTDDHEISVQELLTNLTTYPYQFNTLINVAWGKLYRKALFNQISFPAIKLYEDQATIYKLYLRASKVVYCRSNQYYYQMANDAHPQQASLTHQPISAAAIQARIHLYEEQLSLLTFIGYDVQNYRGEYVGILHKYLKIAQDLHNGALIKYIQSKLAVLN